MPISALNRPPRTIPTLGGTEPIAPARDLPKLTLRPEILVGWAYECLRTPRLREMLDTPLHRALSLRGLAPIEAHAISMDRWNRLFNGKYDNT